MNLSYAKARFDGERVSLTPVVICVAKYSQLSIFQSQMYLKLHVLISQGKFSASRKFTFENKAQTIRGYFLMSVYNDS